MCTKRLRSEDPVDDKLNKFKDNRTDKPLVIDLYINNFEQTPLRTPYPFLHLAGRNATKANRE